jgi:UDP-GlcNAc:undecaprenyl-phosphate GlcNAc-1-phosphate transferase
MINFIYLILPIIAIIILYFFIKNRNFIGKFFNVLDLPGKDKIHSSATPLIGSFPIIFFSILSLIFFNLIKLNINSHLIFYYSYLFFIMGYIDDRFNINAYIKLFISIFILIFALNFSEVLVLKKIYVETFNRHFFFERMDIFFTLLCMLLLINALNLMDGINGLASGFATLWLLSLSMLSTNNIKLMFLFLSIFMIVNTYAIIRGKYFLGDSGTLFLGSLIGFLTIFTYNNLLLNDISISVEKIFIFFMIPGIDMFRLFVTRLVRKKDPFTRDLNHLHHLMLNYFSLYLTLIIYLLLFITTNLLSFFNILDPIIVIFLYLVIYIFFVFFSKKKLKNAS